MDDATRQDLPPSEAAARGVLAALRGSLPPRALICDAEAMRVYECDALTSERALPLAVCLPENEAQVRDILILCHRYGVPVVARGAGTCLSGGARPQPGGILLALTRMRRIVRVDAANRLAVVEAGVSNAAISAAAAPHGLMFAPDPSSQVVSTIAGNVAENAGGVHCVKYGMTVHHLLALRAVTSEGEILEIGLAAPDAPGYDLLALLSGSEGTLAVVTEVTVRLVAQPQAARVARASFASVAAAGAAVSAIVAAGIVPAGLELMDGATVRAVGRHIDLGDLGIAGEAAALLLCELDGMAEDVDAGMARVEALLTAAGGSAIRVSQSEAERQSLWAARKAAFPAISALMPDNYCMDGSIPRRHLAAMLSDIAALETEYGLQCINVFHAGDGNLHPMIMYDAARPGDWEKAEAFGQAILEKTVALGGTITGEHGVGVEKLDKMHAQFGAAELRAFRRIKAAFDGDGLLNPGKAVPPPREAA